MPSRSGNLKEAAAMNEGDGQITQGGHALRRFANIEAVLCGII